MHELTGLIRQDMKPALGVTEPGAIAFAVASAKQHTKGEILSVKLWLNSGMYKNAFTCGIPGSDKVGNAHAAALGAVGADPDKGLECLEGITPEEARQAEALVEAGKIQVEMAGIDSRIFIEATVKTREGEAAVLIRDSHTNIVRITENGQVVLQHHRHDLRRGQPGLCHEGSGGGGCRLPLCRYGHEERLHLPGSRNQRLHAGGDDAKHRTDRLTWNGWDGEDDD